MNPTITNYNTYIRSVIQSVGTIDRWFLILVGTHQFVTPTNRNHFIFIPSIHHKIALVVSVGNTTW